jgi:hypothetical protein
VKARRLLATVLAIYFVWLSLLIIAGLGLGTILFLPCYLLAIPIIFIMRRISAGRPLTPLWLLLEGVSLGLMLFVMGIPLWQWMQNGFR